MLDAKVKELINKQINQEFYSEYLYLAFANYFYDNGLDGFANWYDVQAQEERDHAMLMRTYLHNNGERVTFSAIAEPQNDFGNARIGRRTGLLLFVHRVVVLGEGLDDACQRIIEVRRFFTRAGNDERRPRFVDED